MTSEDSDDANVTSCSGEQLEQLLCLGLPSKLTDISERSLDKQDFIHFRPQAEKCLNKVEKICEKELLTPSKWPLVALLFAHEHSYAPYTSGTTRKISTKILSAVEISKEIGERVFEFVKSRLTREGWKFFVGERYILVSLCHRFPSPETQLPPILNICDCFQLQNKLVGAHCLLYLSSVFTHDDDFGGRADVIIDCLLKLSYAHNELRILSLVYEALENLLLKCGICHSRRSAIHLHLLRQCGLAVSTKEKILLGEILMRFLRGLSYAAEEYAQATLELIEYWVDVPSTRITALCILQCALSCGTVTKSWERAARLLLSCASRCRKTNEEEIAAILLCRRSLREIRTSAESAEELALYDAIR